MDKNVQECYGVYVRKIVKAEVFWEVACMVEEEVRGTFSGYPEVIYGFTDIAYSALAGAYESALVFAVPYGERLTVETYSEEKFEKGIQGAKKESGRNPGATEKSAR